MRWRRILVWSWAVLGAVLPSSVPEAQARQDLARTCIATIETDQGPMQVLRKVGPQAACPPGEILYVWDRFSITWRGDWEPGTTYAMNAVVGFAGSSWVSLSNDNLGNPPDVSPQAWGLLALEGEQGATGPAGASGPAGATGPMGSTGATGSAGATGAPGAAGTDGAVGPQGDAGRPERPVHRATPAAPDPSARRARPVRPATRGSSGGARGR